MRWARLSCSLALGLGLVAGCANVKVKKIDVERRIAGKDNHVKGFRYYLNRPYIVVGKPISVSTTIVPVAMASYQPADLATDPKNRRIVFVGLVPPQGSSAPLVYNTEGEVERGLTRASVDLVDMAPSAPDKVPAPQGASAPGGDDATILARTVAALVKLEVQARKVTSIEALPPGLGDEIDTAMDSTATNNPPSASSQPPDLTLQAYGNRVVRIFFADAVKLIDGHGELFPTPANKAAFEQKVFDLTPEVADKLFTLNPKPPSRATMLARAVGTYAYHEVNAVLDILTTPVPKQDRKDLLPGLVSAAEASVSDQSQTLQDVVNSAVKATVVRAQDKSGNAIIKPEAVRQVVENTLKNLDQGTLARQLLPTPALLMEPTKPVATPPAPAPSPSPAGAKLAFAQAPTVKPAAPAATDQTPAPVVADPDAIQVMYLPDFEEQYAIRNKNFLARTKYQYKFTNGTELSTFSGNYNATDVPVKLLETVGTLIQAAGSIAKQQLNPAAAISGAALTFNASTADPQFYLKIEQVIEPGVYRIQKSWERVAATPTEGLGLQQVEGMFSDIGLKISPVTSIIPASQLTDEVNALKAKADKAAGKAAPPVKAAPPA